MSTDTIENLRKSRDSLKSALKSIKIKDYEGRKYGAEQEYDIRGLVSGVDAIASDIGGLLRAPKRFLQSSSHNERVALVKNLKALADHLTDEDMESTCRVVETLKPAMRSYGVRYSDERLEEFIEKTNDLQRKIQKFSELIVHAESSASTIEDIKTQSQILSEQLKEKFNELEEHHKEVSELVSNTEEQREKVNKNFETDRNNSAEIERLLSEVRSHAETIDSFSKKVANRENQIEIQEGKAKHFEDTLSQYTTQQEKYISDAKGLIKSAMQALEYKTAEGLSAAFIEQHKQSKNPWVMWAWVLGAMVFILLSAGLGIWLMLDHEISTSLIIGRTSLLPILIGGSVFCASQYIKQKNIAEDYAYKTVLAKSLVGFSEQLSSEGAKGEEYALYIKTVLSEMLVDPLRKPSSPTPTTNRMGDKHIDAEKLLKALEDLPARLEKVIGSLNRQ